MRQQQESSSTRPRGVWQPPFRRLWAAATVSELGSQITVLALPLTAALTLRASALQMGLLTAAGTAPYFLIALPAGVWVDRHRRRPLMIIADLGRTLLLALIPLVALVGLLRIELLYGVAVGVGALTVLFGVAANAYLPSVLSQDALIEGNGRLLTSTAAAQTGGPALAGGLVQLVTAPIAIAADALSFLLSAPLLARINVPECVPRRSEPRGAVHEAMEGLAFLLRQPLLRGYIYGAATINLFGSAMTAVFVLFATRELQIRPGVLGIILGGGAAGGLAGASCAARIVRRIGIGPAIVAAATLFVLSSALMPLAQHPWAPELLVGAEFLTMLGVMVFDVSGGALAQTITPAGLRGRRAAAGRFITQGVRPFGALAGGVLGSAIGLRSTLIVCAVGGVLALIPVWSSASAAATVRTVAAAEAELEPALR